MEKRTKLGEDESFCLLGWLIWGVGWPMGAQAIVVLLSEGKGHGLR